MKHGARIHGAIRKRVRLRSRVFHAKYLKGRGRRMNTVSQPGVPQPEVEQVTRLLEKPQERDPGEVLPWLPCTLAVDLPVSRFTVRDLLRLSKGSIVETGYHQSSDLPLRVNGQLVGWTEFEVAGERLAVRLTDLS